MGQDPGAGGLSPRLFLVAPNAIEPGRLAACLEAACAAGDLASLLVPGATPKDIVAKAQALGVAVVTTGSAADAARLGADGLHVEGGGAAVAGARAALGKDRIVGAFAGSSRDLAMELAEAGADYVALSQNGPAIGGEPIVAWWSDFFEIPSIAFDPVEPGALATVLPQNPDFLRPSDAMWDSPEAAGRIVGELMKHLSPP